MKLSCQATVSNVIVSDIDTAPSKRSAKATQDSRMFEFFFSFSSSVVNKRFNRIVKRQVTVVVAKLI